MSTTMMSVSSLNTKIKSLLEATFMHTMVEAEVASATYHSSGHLYFTIKDKNSSIKCVMWRSSVSRMKFHIEKGMHIVVEGSVSVYMPRGEYQFQTVRIEPYGQGALALAYEQLKQKLKEKGYFDRYSKKPLPKHIKKIVLVTAKNSAGLHDMLKIIENRWALLEVLIVDTLVQGEMASTQIAHGLRYADSLVADVVVVGRGGGSSEDLWAFNEERVADAIFAMRTPVVSAVGHEVDILISDLVADVRASTPSSAIEMILPDSKEILYTLSELQDRFVYAMKEKMIQYSREVQHREALLLRSSPLRKIEEVADNFARLKDEFSRVMKYILERHALAMPKLHKQYRQTMLLKLDNKAQELSFVEKNIAYHHPKNQCRTGWAKTSVEGKVVALSSLQSHQSFILEDEFTKIEALCLRRY